MSDEVLDRENLTDLVYFLRHHKALQDAPETCDWTCACNGRLDKIVAHDAALRKRVEELEEALHRDDSSEGGAGLIPAVEWMLDILEMYESRLKDFGDPPELVHSDVNEAAKAKARRDLRAARDLLDEMEADR